MKDKTPKISIIIAVYNGAKTLQRCIDSIVNQTYKNIELIIIDGASTDGTVDIIKANEEHIAYWESKPDRGIYHAWNKALKHVTGDWVYFLGADDLLYDNRVLSKAAENLSDLPPSVMLAYGKVMMVSELGESLGLVGLPWEKARERFLVENTIPHQGLFHHKCLFERLQFDLQFSISGDYELILRAISHGYEIFFLDDFVVARMQAGGVSGSPKSSYLTMLEFSKARKINGYNSYSVAFLWILMKAYIKKFIFSIKSL